MLDHATTQRFWAKADVRGDNDCWPWMASTNHRGYGRFVLRGKCTSAPRVAWMIGYQAELPADRFACHTCDNTGCVNPKHIWPGTHSQNVADSVRKRRHNQARKLHCVRGHPLVAENLYVYKNERRCRECLRANTRAFSARRRSA